jgi:hypothetical protein
MACTEEIKGSERCLMRQKLCTVWIWNVAQGIEEKR